MKCPHCDVVVRMEFEEASPTYQFDDEDKKGLGYELVWDQCPECDGFVVVLRTGRYVEALDEIEQQGWSLNPGRYVGIAARAADDFVFAERLEELNEELEILNVEARELEKRIAENVAKLLEEVV